MDTQHLKAFLTVARSGSFTTAAQQLYLTQPAISKRIAALEELLDCRLFDRFGRSVTLTEAGKALLPRAEQILQSVADTELALANLAGEVRGPLRLATSHHIGLHHLPQILQTFTRAHPQVQLELDFIDSEQAYEALQRGDIELALVTLPDEATRAAMSGVEALPLWHDPLSLVVAPDHPLALSGASSLAQLANYPAILPAAHTYTSRRVQALFESHHLTLNTTMATNYLETIKMMASIGLGWSALPDTMLGSSDPALAILDIAGVQLSRTLGCVSRPDRTLSNAARAFLTDLQATRTSKFATGKK
ncbi:LysR family transcriptional regulator [Pseudomaricurvus sp. HS19]|uniref:LysR family transcriptional regulator n=1 Tax=Pseudomaricurvus sp. HS19 TaxID=2692626 RepID=UPI001367D836|nr:LysR family transcriptional regulator [Pseudomaricurvus sp. HS19]MYM62734.1 LysR family transcriptional regulator [Pseudomaricurvus sp. HS19]